jgi:PTH1 family peptidyl-tRNA hydrolase
MICVVGLGNYPEKYLKTRHNFGFLAIDYLVKTENFSEFKFDKKFFGEVCVGNINDKRIICLKPHTYMNLSGKSVLAIKNFYKLNSSDFFIFSDDLDLDFGVTRFRKKGSAGGQNGIKDIISVLGTPEIPRVKFGINSAMRTQMLTENFVLSKFTPEETAKIPEILKTGIQKFKENI